MTNLKNALFAVRYSSDVPIKPIQEISTMKFKHTHTLPNGVKVLVTSTPFSPSLCQASPTSLFVFGDNLRRHGSGGQAVIRHEPNSFGIATKVAPDRRDVSYFTDIYPNHAEAIIQDFNKLYEILNTGNFINVVFPAGGLGTGLADMPNKAPKTYQKLCNRLLAQYNVVNGQPIDTELGSLADLI